ncbi:MAG: phage major capsid protein [Burkholderiaceae bacterium]
MDEIKALAETQAKLLDTSRELKGWMEKANNEIESVKKLDNETKAALDKLSTKAAELTDKCLDLERRISDAGSTEGKSETAGELLTKSEAFQAMAAGRSKFARVELKTAIVNATGQNQPLVADMRVPGIVTNPNRVLTIRDLMPVGRTASNLVQFTKENVYTNNAAAQYSSPNRENVTKPESGITFTLANAAVVTLAHFIPVSRQVLDDAPQLESYVNGRLLYGLKLEEEDQLLNGAGTSGSLSGLLASGNNTAYNRSATGDTRIDTLRKAITQAALSEYMADAIVINPEDWEAIELTKATDGQYIMANPMALAGPQIWGKRVVATNSIAEGTFLVGAFTMGAQVWDRMDAAVQISYEDGDNFKKNMATLLAEERLALTVYRPAAFIKGTF